MEQYKAYLGLTGDMGFSLEATSEEEAITTALKGGVLNPTANKVALIYSRLNKSVLP